MANQLKVFMSVTASLPPILTLPYFEQAMTMQMSQIASVENCITEPKYMTMKPRTAYISLLAHSSFTMHKTTKRKKNPALIIKVGHSMFLVPVCLISSCSISSSSSLKLFADITLSPLFLNYSQSSLPGFKNGPECPCLPVRSVMLFSTQQHIRFYYCS